MDMAGVLLKSMERYTPVKLTDIQLDLIQRPLETRLFIEGPAGCGKTTVGVERLLALMAAGVPGDSILLLAPQRTLAEPYLSAMRYPGVTAGGAVSVLTVGGLAQRMVDLFWPVIAGPAGFRRPDELPTFLTLETAQYYMAHLVRPLMKQGMFESLHLERNRLYSQIIDNLNKAALVGFPYTDIGARLQAAWGGEPGQSHIYTDAQQCATLFRQYCLERNLLDFSLQLDVFRQYGWQLPACREYLNSTYHHLIYDNLEEDTPVAHSFVHEWLPDFSSAYLIYDHHAGYRRFLGADPQSGYRLKEMCSEQVVMADSLVCQPRILALQHSLVVALNQQLPSTVISAIHDQSAAYAGQKPPPSVNSLSPVVKFAYPRFYPQMLDWVTNEIVSLVKDEGVSPSQVVVLAPFMTDALRFSLANRLEQHGIPTHSHRPSRSLREEPITQCLLTLSALAFPEWDIVPTHSEVTSALLQAIDGLDLVRGQLLTDIVYRTRQGKSYLSSFDRIELAMQQRITFRVGECFEYLRAWLENYRSGATEGIEFDHFISRLFGEVLSQPGFGFHTSYFAGELTANLIESIQKFRWATQPMLSEDHISLGKEYLAMVADGVIAAQYIRSWQLPPGDAVLLAPAYTFLMNNRPVDYQFWLDIGERSWSQRINQPLTHPYVLSQAWQSGEKWDDIDEMATSQVALTCLVQGLLYRCRSRIYLGVSELGETGYEQRSPLLLAFQHLFRDLLRQHGS